MTYALLAIGADRVGIVAGITAVLERHGVNIEDTQMSILRGQFAMVLILGAPPDVDVTSLRDDLAAAGRRLALEAVVVSEVADAGTERAEPTHSVTVYGADHPGIVHAAASALAEAGINVTNLTTRLGGGEEAIYLMILEVAVPEGTDPAQVLGPVAEEQSVEVQVHPLETATAL